MKTWQCSVCKYIHKGKNPPDRCPVCNVPAGKFKEMKKVPGVKDGTVSASGLEKIYSLLIKHHAHPVSVHTPNGILPAAVILWVAAWLLGSELFASAAMINMILVIIALPFVLFTGVLEWKKKYNSALTSIFKLKIFSASMTTLLCIINLIWYIANPHVLSSSLSWLFILLNIAMVAFAGIAGHIGGRLVFKNK